jgi:GNAT superfamily N-acetyltransferase
LRGNRLPASIRKLLTSSIKGNARAHNADNAQYGAVVMVVTFRLAHPHERLELEALQLRASIVWDEYRDAILANPDAIELPLQQILDGRVCVAERHGKIVGFSVVLPRDDGDAELDGLFVDPAVWRNGIGLALVREAERRVALDAGGDNAGHRTLHVVANPRAEAFYLACGFTFTGAQTQTRFGIARTMKNARRQ